MLTDNVPKNRHLLNRRGFLDNPARCLSSMALFDDAGGGA